MKALPVIDAYEAGIYAIDSGYFRPGAMASHLIVRNGEAAFVDVGANSAVPLLLGALEHLGLAPAQVRYLFITHVHLDHAGGAGELMRELPEARAVLHPRGAPHLVDPGRLEAATRAVYGTEAFDRLFGHLVPIAEARIRSVEDGERLPLGKSSLEVWHTEGHARHHFCLYDPESHGVFAGDCFGIAYRELETDSGRFVFPTTTPTQFDPNAARDTLNRIMAVRPLKIFLAHYSQVDRSLERLAQTLWTEIDFYEQTAREYRDRPDRLEAIFGVLRVRTLSRLEQHGITDGAAVFERLLPFDIRLNAMGLDHWISRQPS
jgi:glyoxylase-like metal-dependent hydrolase (beta-lactamase superfamily II)